MSQKVLLIVVFLSVFVVVNAGKRRKHGHCPSRDDENHECCDWEIKTYQQTIKYCRKCKVTPTNSSDICYYRARRHRYKQGCVVSFKYNVTEATCTPKCCEGWTRDEYGQCSIETDANTQEIVCENGGSPADDYCYCPDGFSGKHCESAVCTPHCLNNGICSGRDGEAICICPDGKYTGKQCETPVCDPACQNGGSCIDGIYRPMCSCPPGYEGESCEKEVKDGDCPAPSGSGICAEMCKTDSECPNEQKCCRNGCYAHQCMAPAATTCTYQGEQYPVGHRLQNNSCTTCVCKDPNSKNQWECVSISCPRLQCYKTKMIPNLCCPVCDDMPTTTTTTPAPTTTTATRIPTTTLPSTCKENGTHYPMGATITRNNYCERCTCIYTASTNGELYNTTRWQCMVTDCFWDSSCSNMTRIPGQCCPICTDNSSTTTLRPPTTKRPATSCNKNGTNYVIGSEIRGNNSCDKCICGYYGQHLFPTWNCSPAVQCLWFPSNCTNITTVGCCPTCADVPTTKAPTTTTTPLRSTCIKDGIEYPEGSEVASTDNCNSCICIKVEKQHPEWICRGVDCPPLKCESQKSITGQCCPVCDDKPPDECGPICKMYCKNGFQTDERGCPLCICKSTTTTTPAPTNISQSCIYDGEVYPKGHHIMKTDCMMCTCLSIYEQKPDWNCMINDCQQPKCSNPVKIPGQCCPVCPATSTLAPTTPKSSTCSFNGTQYQHRSTVKQTDCKTCVCQYQYGGYLNWSCSIEACVYCANPRMIPGQCCPMCNGTTPRPTTVRPTLPPNTGPSFKHCPSNTLIINTHREKFINIRRSVNLTVVDNSGTRYTIRYSKEIIEAIPCSCGKNIHIITAQSDPPDQYGRFASCHITVHVVDNHPPIYSSCPADIAAFEDEIISWDKPKATDNIGIKSEKIISDYENDSKFPEGTHVVMYVSVDHEGNVGVCRFLVAIYKRGSSDPTMPSELKKENRDNSKMNITLSVIGLLVGVVLLIAVVLWALYCRRMKKRRNEQTTGSESNAYNNEIYATTPTPKTPPPSYGKAGGMKLPPEYITGDDKPPMYEELDVKVFSKKGIHNPVYDTSVDLDAADIEVQVQKEECHQD
ncbi:kielin/chordin-like protein isoform X4 [Mytilus californianus]|uniref:kielin/chordin-like protein isoform X4 n=1 Tax=Mytilus californianus TaxID=6549 RepID=UPI002246EAF9|nr:kielin/chordin-like protein isoform X4 [Mytilus californianus]